MKKYLYVNDSSVANTLIDGGCVLLQQIRDIEQNLVWVLEYDPSKNLCFDINDTSIRRACVVSDHLTMRF